MKAIVKYLVLTIVNFLVVTELWIALTPFALFYTGAALNQLCLIANHDKFPVMMNAHQIQNRRELGLLGQGDLVDNYHCIMSKKTKLNFLGDIFDLRDDIEIKQESIGDLMLLAGEAIKPYAIVIWVVLAAKRLREQNERQS